MKRLGKFIRRFFAHRTRFLLGILAIPGVAFCDISLTLLIGKTLNRLKDAEDTVFLRGVFFTMLAYAAAQGVFRFLHRWFIVGVSRTVEVELKQDLFDKLTTLPLSYHAKSRSGDIVITLTTRR